MMKSIILVILSIFVLSSLNFAATYAVNGTGSSCYPGAIENYSTIQSAINSVSDGSTIIVCANGSSVYNENVEINRSINLYGNQSGVRVAANTSNTVFNISQSYVNITNFTTSGATGALACGIKSESISPLVIQITNTTVYNSTQGFCMSSGVGIVLINNTAYNVSTGFGLTGVNFTVRSNTVYNSSYGFTLICNDSLFDSNLAYNINFSGFVLGQSGQPPPRSNVFTSNTVCNVTSIDPSSGGFKLDYSAYNNTFTSNTIYNFSNGFYLSTSPNNTITNNHAYNNSQSGFYLTSSSDNNTLLDNIANNNSQHGFYATVCSGSNLTNNTAFNNYPSGFRINLANNSILTSNSAYDNDVYGFQIDGNGANVTNNLAYNNGDANFFVSVNNATLTNNTAHDGNNDGFVFVSISNVTMRSNIAYNNTITGFEFSESLNNTLINNTASNNSQYGFFFSSSNRTILTSNLAVNNSLAGFLLSNSHNNTLTNNTAHLHANTSFADFLIFFGSLDNALYNNTAYDSANGFLCVYACNITTFEGNNVTNATQYGIMISSDILAYYGTPSSITFSGNNGIYRTPSTGKEIYIYNSTLSTGSYDLATSNMSFALNTTSNVSIKIVDLNALGMTTVSSISDVSFSSGKIVQNPNSNYYGLNVTNTSAAATFSPRLFYNSSDLTGYSTSYLGVGSTSSAGSWTYRSGTVNITESSVYYSGISSFSYFAPLVYIPSTETVEDDDDDNNDDNENPALSISYSTACEQNTVTVTSGSSAVAGVTVKVGGDSMGTTNSHGEVTFSGCGKEVIIAASKSGYSSDYLTATLISCLQCIEQPECTANSQCNSDEFCSNNKCTNITGTCGFISNHVWIAYQCCVTSDCSAGQECKGHVCTLVQQPPTENITVNDTPPTPCVPQIVVQPPVQQPENPPQSVPKPQFDLVTLLLLVLAGLAGFGLGAVACFFLIKKHHAN